MVWCFRCIMCKTPVIHMFHICNTGVYPTYLLHVQNYMCNICVYPTPLLHVWKCICNKVYILHMHNMCRTYVLQDTQPPSTTPGPNWERQNAGKCMYFQFSVCAVQVWAILPSCEMRSHHPIIIMHSCNIHHNIAVFQHHYLQNL